MKTLSLVTVLAGALIGAGACGSDPTNDPATDDGAVHTAAALAPADAHARAIAHGRELWLTATFGGETFFSLILPAPPFNLRLGLDDVVTSNRDTRFDRWGVLNDPDCTAGDASTGFLDRCADPGSTGVIGIRRFPNPTPSGPPVLLGVACASCHAALDPTHPPANPNHPAWENIVLTLGNPYVDTGKVFAAHLSPHDPRWQIFHSWAKGTVDTTAIENDHINNPGAITPIFNLPERPFFNFTDHGVPIRVHSMAQGGEDSVGCEKAVQRVYFNIGMCARECMIGHLANGPGGSQTPIDLDQCRRDCDDFRRAEQDAPDICAFLDTPVAPRLLDAPGGAAFVDLAAVPRGERVFWRECASCHSNGQPLERNVLSNDEVHFATGLDLIFGEPPGAIGTQRCRALSTNWAAGHIWDAFSPDQYKERPTGGPGYYRNVPLLALWATAPFLHNNRLGLESGDPSVAGRIEAYEDAMDKLLNPPRRDFIGSIQRTTTTVDLPGVPISLPAGVPVNLFANLDPNDPAHNLCPELIENGGHYYGAWLSREDKRALTEFLKTR